jgi:predicted permease
LLWSCGELLCARPIALRRSLKRAARGNILHRKRWTTMMLSDDIFYGLRRLLATPVHTSLALLTLAFGVGSTTAIFSVVNGVLLRPLPYEEPDELVVLHTSTKSTEWYGGSDPEYFDLRKLDDVFTSVAAYTINHVVLGDAAEPRRIRVLAATSDLWPALSVAPLMGRTFTADDDVPARDRVAVISWELWQRQYGGSENVLGQTLRLNDRPIEIIGVMPRGFAFPDPMTEAWITLRLDTANPVARNNHYMGMVARLRSDVTIESARVRLDVLASQSQRAYPEYYADGGYRLRVRSLREHTVGAVERALYVLLGAVGLVLAIACVNVANLLLVRGEVRRREIAMRAALGAQAGRLVRMLFAESAMLAIGGGLLGIGLAWWSVAQLPKLAGSSLPRSSNVAMDGNVLAFTLVLVILTALAFGMLPALGTARANPADALKEGGTGRVGGRRRQAVRRSLVVLQLTLAVALVLGAGVLLRSVVNLYAVDAGLRTDSVLTMRVTPMAAQHPDHPEIVRFHESVIQRMSSIPGVTSAGAVSNLPFTGGMNGWSFQIEGRVVPTVGEAPAADINQVTPGYFETVGQQIVRGRAFNDRDLADSPPVVILSEALAARHFPGEDPIGKRMRVFTEGWPWMEIVGVVRDVHQYGVDRQSFPAWYVPHAQAFVSAYTSFRDMTLVVGTPDPAALATTVRAAIRELDASAPIENVRSMRDLLDASLGTRRFTVLLITLFGAVALFLAAVGVYGVIAWSVQSRSREIGVRMALGARQRQVLMSVLKEAVILAATGVFFGLAVGALASSALRGLVYNVSPMDPATCALVIVLLLATAGIASVAPALRATRVDPLDSLRVE